MLAQSVTHLVFHIYERSCLLFGKSLQNKCCTVSPLPRQIIWTVMVKPQCHQLLSLSFCHMSHI